MATSFKFRYTTPEEFPQIEYEQTIIGTTQLTLFDEIPKDVQTKITNIGMSENALFHKYRVYHEFRKKFIHRYEDKILEQLIAIEEFNLYVPKNYSYIWAQATDPIINEMEKRFLGSDHTLILRSRDLDLRTLYKQEGARVSSGWFTNLTIPDLDTASLYGPTVTESDDWLRFEDSGILSAITMDFEYLGKLYKIIILQNGGIVIYNRLTEKEYLEIIEKVNDVITRYEIR